jgi:hypothetical protein
MEKPRGIKITNVDKQKQCDIHVVSKRDIERHCMKLWANSEGTWNHYLAAKEYEKILAKRHGC